MAKKRYYLQKKCYMHHQPFVIAYRKNIPHNPTEAAIEVLEVIEVLRPVFEPTSADLRVGCVSKSDRKWNTKANPPTVGWHILASNLPKEAYTQRENYAEEIASPVRIQVGVEEKKQCR